jgi:uncharacterized membrane protein
MKTVLVVVLTTLFVASGLAQQHPATLPQVNGAIQSDVSRPLSDLATEGPSRGRLHEIAPFRVPHQQQLTSMAQQGTPVHDGALQSFVSSPVGASLGLNLLGVGNGFPGYTVSVVPADADLAVGDTQVVQWVDVSYAVFDKASGAVISGPMLGSTFWAGFGGGCEFTNGGDMIIQWDKLAHRWIATQNVYSSPFLTCVAISTSPDATGTYYRYSFPQPHLPDYPKWGVWPDGYYQTQNNFSPDGSTYYGPYVCAYDRTKMLAGDPTAQQICFQLGVFDSSLLPADLDSPATPPPAGQPELLLGSINTGSPKIYQYLFHADFVTPSNSTISGGGGANPITVAAFSMACGGFGACVPQPNVPDMLDAVGDRLLYRLAYRNFSDHQTWLASHSVATGSSMGERWYEFRAPENSTNLSVYQQGTYAPDSSYRWMGSLAMDKAQDIALGYSVSSSSLFPSLSYTGRVPGDGLGTMEGEALIVSGSGSQTGSNNRWGDYTSMAIDPTDDCTFWYTAQYYELTASFNWSTQLASLKFPTCGSAPDFSMAASPTSLTIGQNGQATVAVTTGVVNGFNNAVALSASGAPAGVTVTFNPSSIPAPGNGSASMNIAVSGTALVGSYTLTLTGSGGGVQHSLEIALTITAPGSFTISASPSSLSVTQGSQGTTTATTAISGAFNSAITLSASGLPAGTTVSFGTNPIAAPGNGTSTVNFAVASTTAVGSYPITLTGIGGGVQQSTTLTLNVVSPPTFTLQLRPMAISVGQGQQGTTGAFTSVFNGFNAPISLTASNAPAGVTVAFATNPIPAPGSGSSGVTVSVSSSTPTGTYGVTVSGSGGGVQQSVTMILTVTSPNFTISASPSSLAVAQGAQGTSTIGTTISAGFNGAITLSASGLPSGTTASFSTNPIPAPGSGSSTLTLRVGASTPVGTYPVTVTGTGGGLQRTATVTLTVTSFTISALPASLSIPQANQASTVITTTPVNGFNGAIGLSASGLPAGTTAAFSPATIPAPGLGTSTLTITTSSSTPAGTYTVTVTGTGGGAQKTMTLTLTVTASDFTMIAAPSSQTVRRGSQVNYLVTLTSLSGFAGSVSLTVSGCPDGTTCSFSPASLVPTGVSTFSVAAAQRTHTGTYVLTITGTNGSLHHSVNVSLTVQ